MNTAYILINAKSQNEHEIYNYLSNYPQIIELKPLFREYDMIVKVEIDNAKELGDFVTNKIKSLNGVIDTKTLQ